MTSRNFIFTLNNPDEIHQEYLEAFYTKSKASYLCGLLEKGKEGTVHLQFFCHMAKPVRPTSFKKVDNKVHVEIVKINNGADDYCMKEDTRLEGPWEFGIKPVKRNSKVDWETVYEEAKQGNFEKIPADIKVKHYGNLCKIAKDSLIIRDHDMLRGTWIYGKAGIGKSRKAREGDTPFYPKLCNKWWDGYKGEGKVIMDDFGPEHKVLAQLLKIWSDRYGCILETKGGALTDRYTDFIVTSQYTIEEIWADDPRTIEALKRRFKCIHMDTLVMGKANVEAFAAARQS